MGARFVRGRLGAALAVAAVSLIVTPGATAKSCPTTQLLGDKWTRIAPPDFSVGHDLVSDYDVHVLADQVVAATNGTSVHVSRDGGCDWTEAPLPNAGPVSALPQIGETKIVSQGISRVRFQPSRPGQVPSFDLWAIGQTDLATEGLVSTQPRVLFSDDGRPFELRTGGLPAFGRPVAIVPTGPQAATLLFKATVPSTAYSFWTTTNGGQAWTQQGESSATALEGFVQSGRHVWAWSSSGVYDAELGDALRHQPTVLGPIAAVEVAPTALGTMQVVAYARSGAIRYLSSDRGATWTSAPAPEGVHNVSSHPFVKGLRAISSIQTNVLVEPHVPQVPQVDYSPFDDNVSDVRFVGLPTGEGYLLYASSGTALYRRRVPLDFAYTPPPPPPPLPPIDVEVRDRKVVPPKATIKPEKKTVRLRQGQRTTVPYEIKLPPVPTPLDVFFMTDSTGSMRDTIRSLQEGVQDIIDGLAASGVDVNFGVADFRTMPTGPDDQDNYLYKRRREIGPVDTDLADALESITTGGGNSTGGADTGLEAVYQAVTGAGRKDPLGLRGDYVPPGVGAEFRADAMKVVFIATDDTFQHPVAPTDPIASIGEVSEVLQDHGVFLVGLEVFNGPNHPASDSARPDMERLATDSGAVAPPAGVDCDGDGLPDIGAGKPIVCRFEPDADAALADAFLSMLAGIKDLAPIDLAVRGPAKFVRTKAQLHFEDVNVKAPNKYTLPVEFRCTKDNAGTVEEVKITAARAGEVVASTTATFECVAPEPRPEPDPRPLIPPLVAAVLVPPPPPPPAPVSNAQPNVNPNPHPNPDPQVNANSGFAHQEDQQLQLALAENDGVSYEDDLAMSGLEVTGPPVPALAWAAAFAMTGAAAFGARLARRVAPAPAFNPREYR